MVKASKTSSLEIDKIFDEGDFGKDEMVKVISPEHEYWPYFDLVIH